ncbi:hypothetical protein [Bacteriovorax sp. Seq25_V]|uniref:hypothetical protein n=1 Tax=Bacteriovorax sp. Seq25_V TaxID=1201288 RepID=UPI00038A45A0|nr:hypothetical protein [Bacteriovorax sp. Seq25_V]EQC45575.1 glucose-6-phosphate isomerase [Bacteriovorax sp. Seq25_V]
MKINFHTFEKSNDIPADLVIEKITNFQKSKRYDFVETLNNKDYITQCTDVFANFSNINTFVQIGIGGSSLGPEMLITSLKKSDVKFYFFNNVDTDKTVKDLEEIDVKNALFYVVSKSGGTAETLAQFAIITNKLFELGYTEKDLKNHFIFATDPSKNELRKLANEFEITCLDVPPNVGGRFSVLTPVGLLPAIFAGINIKTLCSHAYSYAHDLLASDEFIQTVSKVIALYKEGVNETVLMPYSSLLRDFSFWFVQLWAESLGKKRKGERVGLTPIPGYGATDQHSQMQLFMEGPLNKLMFLVHVDKVNNQLKLSNKFTHPKLKALNKYTLKNLMDAEFFGTLKALNEQGVSHIHLELDKLDENSLSELIIFFELLTAITGHMLEIDPFDQPGVEAGKVYSFEWLDSVKGI